MTVAVATRARTIAVTLKLTLRTVSQHGVMLCFLAEGILDTKPNIRFHDLVSRGSVDTPGTKDNSSVEDNPHVMDHTSKRRKVRSKRDQEESLRGIESATTRAARWWSCPDLITSHPSPQRLSTSVSLVEGENNSLSCGDPAAPLGE